MSKRIAIVMVFLALIGCKAKSAEQRAREQLEKMKEAMPDVEARALEQKVTPEDVRMAQTGLQAADEYLGPVNGQLDAVTVNAIEAFQRGHGLKDNGLLDERTRQLLHDVPKKD